MIRGKKYYFFRLSRWHDDSFPEYRIAESVDDLFLRFGDHYMSRFYSVTRLDEVTIGHIRAIDEFLLQQVS